MPIPLLNSVFSFDPAGNHYAVYTPKEPTQNANGAIGRMTGVGYIELEAPDIASFDRILHDGIGLCLDKPLRRRSSSHASRWLAARL